MTVWTRPDAPWFDLYAANARPATGHEAAPCVICSEKPRPGERIADLEGGRGLAHTACVAWQAQRLGGRH